MTIVACFSYNNITVYSHQNGCNLFGNDSRKSDGSEENRGKKKSQKRKKKRRKESRGRKKKKERRRRVSSPTYSDYEPDNPALRNKRR